jgi:hypothetical protein
VSLIRIYLENSSIMWNLSCLLSSQNQKVKRSSEFKCIALLQIDTRITITINKFELNTDGLMV